MKSKIIVILGLLVLVISCQKRKYAEEKVQLQKEDIYFNGYLDNEPISLKIGTDDYYCYASHQQRNDSIYVFTGELKKFECNPCPRSLKVELSDYIPRLPGSSVQVDSALRTGIRNFIPGMSRINTVKLVAHSNKEVASIQWKLSNGSTSSDSIYYCEFTQQGLQTVSLTVKSKGNCETTIIHKIFVGGEDDLFACEIKASEIVNNSAKFTAGIVGGKAPFTYLWNFGDGLTSSAAQPTHNYQWAGGYPVKLQIKDAENNICESNFIHIAGNDKSSCAANITLSKEGNRNAFLNGVKIQWTDQSNTVLKSDNVGQPKESYFEIINSEPYAPNEKGETGRLLTIRFNVLLSDGNRKVWFKSDNTAIAVSYK